MGDRMTQSYLSPISLEPIRALAGFPVQRGTYFLRRDCIKPPSSLQRQFFPDADKWMEEFKQNNIEDDMASIGFLRLIDYLKKVILQDSIFMIEKFPSCPIWKHPIFTSDEFKRYLEISKTDLLKIQSPFDLQLRNSLPTIHHGFDIVANRIDHHDTSSKAFIQQKMENMEDKMDKMEDNIVDKLKSEIASSSANTRLRLAHQIMNLCRTEIASVNNTAPETNALLPINANHLNPSEQLNIVALPTSDIQDSTRETHITTGEIDITTRETQVPINYKMSRQLITVKELWEEWENGLLGQPSISSLEVRFGSKWRNTAAEKKFFQRRKKIIDYIHMKSIADGVTHDMVIAELDAFRERNKLSLHSLHTKLNLDNNEN